MNFTQDFVQAIKSGLANFTNFSGRATRPEFWYWALFNFLCLFVVGIVDPTGILYNLVWLALLIPSLAVGWRRMHDINRAGWWILIPIVDIFLALQPSAPETAVAEG